MLILPAEAPDARLPQGFENRNARRLAVNPPSRGPPLLASQSQERRVRHRLHQAVSQQVEGEPGRADRLRVGHPLLNLGVGERGVGADGAVVDEGAVGDDDGAARDRDVRVAEPAVGAEVADPQLADLARPAGDGVLVALAAGLRVVQRSQAVSDLFDLVEAGPISVVGRVTDHPIALVVEPRGRFGRGWPRGWGRKRGRWATDAAGGDGECHDAEGDGAAGTRMSHRGLGREWDRRDHGMSFALTRYDLGWPATRGGAVSGVTVSCAETVHQTVTSAGGRKLGAGKRIGVLRVGKLPRQDSNLRPAG